MRLDFYLDTDNHTTDSTVCRGWNSQRMPLKAKTSNNPIIIYSINSNRSCRRDGRGGSGTLPESEVMIMY